MVRILIAAVVGGIIVFVVAAIFHIATPLGMSGLSTVTNEDPLLASMRAHLPNSGLYIFPKPTPEDQRAWEEKLRAGPWGLIVYNAEGGEPMSVQQLLRELLFSILAAAVAAVIIAFAAGTLLTRAFLVSFLALFATASVTASYWNWYGFPTAFITGGLAIEMVCWFLAGLAMAKIVPSVR